METNIFCKNIFHQICKLFFFFIIANLFLTLTLFSQVIEKWVARYNGIGVGSDQASDIAIDNVGNIYVTGCAEGFETKQNYLTIKYNSSGNKIWTARYNDDANNNDYATAIAVDSSGNVYVTGKCYSILTNYDIVTVKYNNLGTELWAVKYSTVNSDLAFDIGLDSSNNLYVLGNESIIKYNSSGEEQWIKIYSNSSDDITAMVVNSSGDVYAGLLDRVIKYNTNGIEQWNVPFSSTVGLKNIRDVAIDNSGNIVVSGYINTVGTEVNYLTIKYSSDGVSQWESVYNRSAGSRDISTAMAMDDSGNVYVTGVSSVSALSEDNDYITVKYNNAGAQQWVAEYNGPGNDEDYPYDIAVDNSGNVYVTGKSKGLAGISNYATIKYGNNGIQQWVMRYDGPGELYEDVAKGIVTDSSGNIYVTGYSDGAGTSYDYLTIKYDTNGDTLWEDRYEGEGNSEDVVNAMTVDSLGNIYVTGKSSRLANINHFATVKYNGNGEELWRATFNGPSQFHEAIPNSVKVDNWGNVYVAGTGLGEWSGYDYVVIKYNSLGEEQWVARYDGLIYQYDEAIAIALDSLGNVYITGKSEAEGTFPYNYDFVTIKYNKDGVAQWIRRYNGEGNWDDIAIAIVVDSSRNVYVTGYSYGYTSGIDYVTIKYNTNGVEQWVKRYNTPGYDTNDIPEDIALDSFGNVYVTGYQTGMGGSYDIHGATIKYDENGEQQWVTTFNQWYHMYDIALNDSGNVYLVGLSATNNDEIVTIKLNENGIPQWTGIYEYTTGVSNGPVYLTLDNSDNVYVLGIGTYTPEFTIIKYSNAGVEQWKTSYTNEGWESAIVGIAVDANNNVYIAGTCSYPLSKSDFITIKYSQDVAVNREVWMNY